MGTRPVWLLPLVGVALGVAGCQPPSFVTAPSENAPTTIAAEPRAGGGGVTEAQQQLARLRVAPEDTGAHYDRDDWPHWSSQGQGCSTREIALQQQGRDVTIDDDCRAVSGSWTSSYDGIVVTDSSDLDLDHLVPLAEAARSGTRHWSEQQRETFANDLDQLVVVSARSNRQKGDQDPARWLPDRDRCGYVTRWVAVKTTYELSIDQAERDAIASVLRRCITKETP